MIYLLRHGQTEWNRDKRLQGQGNSDLTELGLAQAAAMAGLLAREIPDARGFRLVSSPLQRARETAAAVASRLDLPIEFDARLAEIALGEWEGRYYRDVQAECAPRLEGATAFDWFFRAPGGESFEAMTERVGGWLRDTEAAGRDVIAVCHGLSGRIVRGLYANLGRETMLALPVPQDGLYRLDAGAITFITASETEPDPRELSAP